jgi:hypothetical protein
VKLEEVADPVHQQTSHISARATTPEVSPGRQTMHSRRSKMESVKSVRSAGGGSRSPTHGGGGGRSSVTGEAARSRKSTEPTVDIGQTMSRIDKKVNQLTSLFKRDNPFDSRLKAAVKIEAIVRGFLVRVRHANFKRGLKEWKWIRCRQVVSLLDILLVNQDRIAAGYVHLKERMEKRIKYSVYRAWYRISYRTALRRRQIKKTVNQKVADMRMNLIKLVFKHLKSVCVGNLSRKYANNERKLKMEVIRNDLRARMALKLNAEAEERDKLRSTTSSKHSSRVSSANGTRPTSAQQPLDPNTPIGVVAGQSARSCSPSPFSGSRPSSSRPQSSSRKTAKKEIVIKVDEEEVIRIFNKQICAQFLVRKQTELMKKAFYGFVKLRAMSKQFATDATSQWLTTRAGKCFTAWKDYINLISIGIQKKVFDGPRTFRVRRRYVLFFIDDVLFIIDGLQPAQS